MRNLKKMKIKRKITENYLIDEYLRISKIRGKEKREEELKALAILSEHVGEYIAVD